jgi:NADPH:quinone reductase-like Zn-dependent oxidoreductase
MQATAATADGDQALVGDAVRAEAGMKAVVQRRYGPPEVLEYTDVARPVVGEGDVLVRVRAASVHPGDYFVMTGVPSIVRLAFGLRRPRSPIPGRDVAGVVEAVGAVVTDLEPGDEVFGWSTTGTLAEYATVPADQLVRKPRMVTMAQAAAVPTSAMTALQALRDIADVQPEQAVLITGASGGVGTFAVQIAKALGAEVTGVCSTPSKKRASARSTTKTFVSSSFSGRPPSETRQSATMKVASVGRMPTQINVTTRSIAHESTQPSCRRPTVGG